MDNETIEERREWLMELVMEKKRDIQKAIKPLLAVDAYKLSHRTMYPEGTEFIYSNLTARGSRIEGVNKVNFVWLS